MKRSIPCTALVLAMVVALAPVALAQECEPTTSDAEVQSGGFYVDWDCTLGIPDCDELCLVLQLIPGACIAWIYQETNGLDGLQRGDEFRDDTCGGMIESDTLIF